MNRILFILFLILIDFKKCFKINNSNNIQFVGNFVYSPRCNNVLKRNRTKKKENYIFDFSLKEKETNKNETNIFDDSYIYHTPVLVNEVIQILDTTLLTSQSDKIINNLNTNKDDISSNNTSTLIWNKENDLKFNNEKIENVYDRNNDKLKFYNNINYDKNILLCKEDEYLIDATLGGGGHTLEILKKFTNLKVISIDKDIEAIYYNKYKLKSYINKNRLKIIHGNYKDILFLLNYYSLPLFNTYSAILADLGLSTHQIKSSKRGFSYKYNDILDMNMNKYTEKEYIKDHINKELKQDSKIKELYMTSESHDNNIYHKNYDSKKIHDILNTYNLKKLKYIIQKFGEEKKAFKIAKKIIEWRKKNGEIITTFDLKNIILSTCKNNYKSNNKVLSRVFQSFRIYINSELLSLKNLLLSSHKILKQGGVLIVISYHSLENKYIDLFVKNKTKLWNQINIQPIVPTDQEIKLNKSSRSAKMFVFKKI
ncbi:S-adenosyl-methyltransferase, putative [Plasmodium berghei]|uniref:S-adenosyl-methyltransferase, putative n=2 Tax=Plasmodium berghei TaxID=5821 RepID=A0A509ASN0_PLABA|nr:S-adenosyl-methyltransferase, putative [Plasmodium berghei ANKA]CXJ26004.1 S-adenosyl-methyltransferase, putative [Plasmodium berghei]SCM26901.1 S-adenosyl-methyltransferase, putative [Plasmodium berghei]SCN28693.1 S-adenosyl-methyltransferase, putative [Plasmodium berghei]SCO62929.1 S-adenosyl-methyltransferase, putative [Plasmodium berghei]SCO64441.1 S-adenosyl-methyltransferase, putative [Plasmodium berghei]|eukprot:XP_034424339.1 S-adenosyl-methyltransferase, putative [Plasmodium berghei ANKA]